MDSFSGSADREAIERVPLEERIPFRNVYEMLRTTAARDPKAPALFWLPNGLAGEEAEEISYAQLLANVTRSANLLHELGVHSGRAVSILLPNLPETHYALWGGSAAGVANPVNPLLSPPQIAEIMAAAGSRVLIVGGPDKAFDVYAKAMAVRSLYPALETVLVVGQPGEGMLDFAAEMARRPDDRLVSGRTIRPDDPSVYFHTGGTTGSPKLAQQTQWNQVFTAWSCAFVLGYKPTDRILTGLPLFHANAAIATGLGAFFAGAASILCGQLGYRSKAMMADFWPIVSRWRATMFSGVPTIYASLLEALPDELDVSSLRFAICGAAPMPVSLFGAFEKRTGVRILEAYGMTEGGAVSAINPRDGVRHIGSVGVRLPYQDVRPVVLDATGKYLRDCETDEVGVFLLKGPNLFPGYKQEKFNNDCWPLPGYFNSGDLGRRDADGYFWLAGRAKDLIIRGGHNIDPAVIEEALHKHPAVELAAAVGMPDMYAGEVPIAYVSLVRGMQASAEALRDFAREHVPERSAAPVEVVIIDAIPVTAVGKIFKPMLRVDAVRRAFTEATKDVDSVGIQARIDDKRGIVADVCCANDPGLRDQVARRLEKFAVPFEFSTP